MRSLRWRWWSVDTILLSLATLFVDAITIAFLRFGVLSLWDRDYLGIALLLMVLVVLPFAFLMTLGTLEELFNSTEIRLLDGLLHIKHGPIGEPGLADLDASQIEQIWVKIRAGSRGSRHFSLHGRFRDGKSLVLISFLKSMEIALWLELTVEGWLGLADDEFVEFEEYEEAEPSDG